MDRISCSMKFAFWKQSFKRCSRYVPSQHLVLLSPSPLFLSLKIPFLILSHLSTFPHPPHCALLCPSLCAVPHCALPLTVRSSQAGTMKNNPAFRKARNSLNLKMKELQDEIEQAEGAALAQGSVFSPSQSPVPSTIYDSLAHLGSLFPHHTI